MKKASLLRCNGRGSTNTCASAEQLKMASVKLESILIKLMTSLCSVEVCTEITLSNGKCRGRESTFKNG